MKPNSKRIPLAPLTNPRIRSFFCGRKFNVEDLNLVFGEPELSDGVQASKSLFLTHVSSVCVGDQETIDIVLKSPNTELQDLALSEVRKTVD
jgi:hypothetical protein